MITLASGLAIPSLKLNIGCGFSRMDGYTNIDLQAFHEPDLVGDALDLVELPSGTFEEVQARDVIEHFRWRDTPRALYEWNRLLQPGGRLYLTTTYLTGLLRRVDYDYFGDLASHKQLIVNLFSMQAYEGDYHLTAFTERLIRFYLWQCGFEVESLAVADGWLFNIWARKVIDYAFTDLLASSGSHSEFVASAYRVVLGREADPGGLTAWTAQLTAGETTRRKLVASFLASEEREDRMMREAPAFELTVDGR